jgi:peptidoglycan/xylan/chitin deacetylase (PgdA/CDA1 family)
MQDAGWEFGAEMYTHSRTARLQRADVEAECYRAQRWLRDNGFGDEPAFVTYPYGSHDKAVLDVAGQYYALGRTVIGNLNRVSVTDPMHLAGHGVYSETVDETKRLVDRADAHNQLLVLNFHGFDEYAWKEMRSEDVREVLDYLDESGLQVQTYSEFWEDLRDLHGV